MIKIKLASLGPDKSLELDIVEGELLSSAFERAMEDIVEKDRFQVLYNGHRIERELWEYTSLKKDDDVLIAPIIAGGDAGSIFKSIALIAITIAASYFAGPAGLGLSQGLAAGFTAAVTIGAGLLLNALIPPPNPGLGLAGGSSYEGSQMYTITSQSNSVKKYGSVPKVYGKHRIFPLIAANPYTSIEFDPSTGELASYLYAIYDFGLGPVMISDLKIGDTPIDSFTDKTYRFVDLNRPPSTEGPWDTQFDRSFTLYRGDNTTENIGVVLEGNEANGGAASTYQAQRTGAENPGLYEQEIILTFIAPKGLIAYSSTNTPYTRAIVLRIEFSKANENNWKFYNDSNFVSSFTTSGGEVNNTAEVRVLPETYGYYDVNGNYVNVAPSRYGQSAAPGVDSWYPDYYSSFGNFSGIVHNQDYYYGLPSGSTFITLWNGSASVGDLIIVNGEIIGTVGSITSSPYSEYSRYYFTSPCPRNITLFVIHRAWKSDVNNNISGEMWTLVSSTVVQRFTVPVGVARIAASQQEPVYATFKFTPRAPGQYKVRVTRVSSQSSVTNVVYDSLSWASIQTRLQRPAIITDKRHAFLELRIKATNQLNGVIQNLSAVCTSVLPVYNGTTWVKQITRNPAWVWADILTGDVNPRAMDKSRLDTASLLEWAEMCDEVPTPPTGHVFIEPRFQCDFVLDFDTTVQELIGRIGGAAQAGLNIIDGKYGVLLDKLRTTPVQVFTNRNSSDFASVRPYPKQVHAVRIQFIDPAADWETTEIIVYDDGFNAENATEIDDLTSFGVITSEQAWRFGRYSLAQYRLRRETFTLKVDFEYLVCTRGDYVQIVQDVMRVGGTAARVKAVDGSVVTTDVPIETDGDLDYAYIIRKSDGSIDGGTVEIVGTSEFDLTGPLPEVGDLIVIGESERVVYDCIIKSIDPESDLTATITLVEKADAIYLAESLNTLPLYDPQLSSTIDTSFRPPGPVEELLIADSAYICNGGGYQHYVDLDWEAPSGSAYEIFEIYVNSGRGFNLAGQTKESLYRYIVDPRRLGFVHEFKVLAVSPSGLKIDLLSAVGVTATPTAKSTPPSDVPSLNIDVTNEVLQLVWDKVPDCDVQEYLIRYSPLDDGASWESSIPCDRQSRDSSTTSIQARPGTYLIKAVDYNGNESAIAAMAITTIPYLFNLNIIAEISDFPELPGTMDKVVKNGDTLILERSLSGGAQTAEFYSEGFYYYEELLDLGDIFTARLQSLIQAEGYTEEDIMSNWDRLSDVAFLSNSGSSEWDVETQYRSTESLNVMSEWAVLADIDPISEGVQENFTPWRRFYQSDATGRIFQFRLRLISNKTSVSPRVFDGKIRVDMPDRVESYNNLVTDALNPENGLEVSYTPEFKGPGTTPNIQITLDSAESGDYWVFEYKTLEGFKIVFYDVNGDPVSRQFDAFIKGFGRKATSII